jgi:hypothetical protein
MDSEISKDERMWGMLCHLGALAAFVFPLGNVVVPLVIWMIKKEDMPFVDDQGKESLNFQFTVVIAIAGCFVLSFVGIGTLLMPVVGVGALVLVIIASTKANDGERYRYPWAIRLLT